MKKLLIVIALLACTFKPASAASQFTTSYTVSYKVNDNATTDVTKQISIKNNTAEYYAADFTLRIPDSGITNIKATRNNRDLAVKTEKKDDSIEVYIKFNDQVVGVGKAITFQVTYTAKEIANMRGKNLEIIIPGIGKDYAGSYTANVEVPKNHMTQQVRVQPTQSKLTDNESSVTYTFTKDQLSTGSVIMNFGDEQQYNMSLLYYLDNPSDNRVRTEIALPPSTEYQTVVYENIVPKPHKVKIDEDGNYLAEYILNPKESKEIQVTSQVIVSAQQRNVLPTLSEEAQSKYLAAQEYWEVEDPKIKELGAQLKEPKAIYDYVISTLTYNKDRRDIATLRRQGALEALNNPEDTVSMEFTDLFIAIARAAGIPAREVNGYGFTDDDSNTLYADNFHAWPEYYDKVQGRWIQVDPTWGDTTGGVDYFNNFDTSHIAFIRRGITSTYPVSAGSYRENIDDKTVFISYRTEDIAVKQSVKATVDEEVRLAGFADQAQLSIENTGNTGYIGTLKAEFSPSGIIDNQIIPVHLPPFATQSLEYPFQLAWNESKEIVVKLSTNENEVLVDSTVKVNPLYAHPYTVIAVVYLVIIFIVLIVFHRFVRHQPEVPLHKPGHVKSS